MSIQVWSLSCLEASCANSLRPKICPNTLCRAHRQQTILSKTYKKRSRIAKFQRNLQDSDQQACPNPQEILGIVLTDCNLIRTKTSLNRQEILAIGVHKFHKCLEPRGFGLNNCLKSQAIFGGVLSDCKNSQTWTENCPNSQKLQGLRC